MVDLNDLYRQASADSSTSEMESHPGSHVAMGALTIINVCLAVYLLIIAISPIVWGEVISYFERQYHESARTAYMRAGDAQSMQTELDRIDRWKEDYVRRRWGHLGLVLVTLTVVLGVLYCAYGTYNGEFFPWHCVGWCLAAAAVTLVFHWLDWASAWWLPFVGFAVLEAIVALIKPCRQYLINISGRTAQDRHEEDRLRRKAELKKQKKIGRDSDALSSRFAPTTDVADQVDGTGAPSIPIAPATDRPKKKNLADFPDLE